VGADLSVSGWEGVLRLAFGHRGLAFLYLGAVPVAHFLGPYLPTSAGAVSFWALFLFVKVWRPRRFVGTAARRCNQSRAEPRSQGINIGERGDFSVDALLVLIFVVVA